jgi:hypothetical protein
MTKYHTMKAKRKHTGKVVVVVVIIIIIIFSLIPVPVQLCIKLSLYTETLCFLKNGSQQPHRLTHEVLSVHSTPH